MGIVFLDLDLNLDIAGCSKLVTFLFLSKSLAIGFVVGLNSRACGVIINVVTQGLLPNNTKTDYRSIRASVGCSHQLNAI